MLQLTIDDIRRLNSGQLEMLIAMLCEAELSSRGLPLSSVLSDGDERAPDGGVDVAVELPPGTSCELDFVKRPSTGFQSKAEPMGPARISKEMSPRGRLRASIQRIVERHGAYIIVSSKDSPSVSALDLRRQAMRDAISAMPRSAGAEVDFYGAGRLATWCSQYPGVDLWVREKTGRPLTGWRTLERRGAAQPIDEYMADESRRVVARSAGNSQAMPVVAALEHIRKALSAPGGSVRLVGLSGVGKTRFVQALADSRIGSGGLDPATTLYVDNGSEPPPTPSAPDMLARLQHGGRRAVLVVDNCGPRLHRQLAEIVGQPDSSLSLLSVEHDISIDEPADTDVFELQPSSTDVLLAVLAQRHPRLSDPDRRTIAQLSDGNAWIALELGRAVASGSPLGVIRDRTIFDRLFWQGQSVDAGLLSAARALSLVYSFDGASVDAEGSELAVIGGLFSMSATHLYGHAAELTRRGLVQRRSRWRALLPHALANTLAEQALLVLPPSLVVEAFESHPRLRTSFSKRLGYLHGSAQAREIARDWLAPGRLLADLARNSPDDQVVFFNIAPLEPARALAVIESLDRRDLLLPLLEESTRAAHAWRQTLRSLAYEPEHFDQAGRLLARVTAAHIEDGTVLNSWKNLFSVTLSGTRARVDARTQLIRTLLESSDDGRLRRICVEAVVAMLESSFFSATHAYSFGAQPRGFGWQPQTDDDLTGWYRETMALIEELVARGEPFRSRLLHEAGIAFRALWSDLPRVDELADSIRRLAVGAEWPAAWIAVGSALRHDADGMEAGRLAQLRVLESDLRPTDLPARIRAHVLSERYGSLDVADTYASLEAGAPLDEEDAASGKARELGELAAGHLAEIAPLLSALLSDDSGRQHEFGQGLASVAPEPEPIWQVLTSAMGDLPPASRRTAMLVGFIEASGARDPQQAGRLLDRAVDDPALAGLFPELQAAFVDPDAPKRLHEALRAGAADAQRYRNVLSRYRGGLQMHDYLSVARGVAGLADGTTVALYALASRLQHFRIVKEAVPDQLKPLGREFLASVDMLDKNRPLHQVTSMVAAQCLIGPEGAPVALGMCRQLAGSDYSQALHSQGARDLVLQLAKLQPEALLTAFASVDPGAPGRLMLNPGSRKGFVLDHADPDAVIRWAAVDPNARSPFVAGEIKVVECSGDEGPRWSRLAAAMLERVETRTEVLAAFERRIHPIFWMGSLKDAVDCSRRFMDLLRRNPDPQLADWASRQAVRLKARNQQFRELPDRDEPQSFE